MSLENTALRLDSVPFRVSEFIRKNYQSIARNTIEREIRFVGEHDAKMTSKQLSKLTINPSDLELEISIKTHGPTKGDKPRQSWKVKPVNAKALSWVSNGTRFFSKGHFVTGADARYVLEVGLKRGVEKFTRELKSITENFQRETAIG